MGTYERAHAGATIVLLTGPVTASDYQIGENPWADSTVQPGVVPPTQWYHQHFNNGKGPARFIRLGGPPGNESFPVTAEGLTTGSNTQIQFKDESPMVRQIFEEQLALTGAKIAMPPREELIRLEEDLVGSLSSCRPRSFVSRLSGSDC